MPPTISRTEFHLRWRALLAAVVFAALLVLFPVPSVGQDEDPEVDTTSETDDGPDDGEAAPPEDRGFRLPVPAKKELDDARKLIGEVYRDLYAQADTTNEKISLANKLLSDARMTEDNLAGRFMMQRVARDIAIGVYDAETAFVAIDEISARFAVDVREYKSEALSRMRGTPIVPVHLKRHVESLMTLYDEAVAADQFGQARYFAVAAEQLSRKTDDIELRKRIFSRSKNLDQLKESFAQVEPARIKLEDNPLDPQANETVGRYLCFTKGDWAAGIPMLALGNNKQFRELARAEMLLDDTDAAALTRLGDQWWTIANDNADVALRKAARQRAAAWYEQAIPKLTGLNQAKVQQRLKEAQGED